MNALAVDCASNTLTVSAKKNNDFMQTTMQMGLRQSEKLLPIIDSLLKELNLSAKELDYTALTIGPGSFTGLRLGAATLKALTLANGTPLYGLNSLDVYAHAFLGCGKTILSLVESKDAEFFYALYENEKRITDVCVGNADEVFNAIASYETVIATGPGTERLISLADETQKAVLKTVQPHITDGRVLFNLAEDAIAKKEPALKDYDGPVYYKKSEAELVLERKASETPST
ncbi:MAG: tRNA (adenosine(37)-N6)-threonylcarbamoyltransferase complex dimerization subunit type 1 TsaB [Treponema sp.]|nr:tRNA (adenosine(37)-N6)-threonylcarbamoyltransferase complex dimerization subunit type 1 TsaB [Treponema sp.]